VHLGQRVPLPSVGELLSCKTDIKSAVTMAEFEYYLTKSSEENHIITDLRGIPY
jgi:hypothetical protein